MEWNDNYTWILETTTLEEEHGKSKEDASYESELAEKP